MLLSDMQLEAHKAKGCDLFLCDAKNHELWLMALLLKRLWCTGKCCFLPLSCECKNKQLIRRYFMPVLYKCVNFIVYLDTETCKAFNLSTAAAVSRVSLVHVQPRFIESSCNCCWTIVCVWVTTKMKMFSCVSPRILSTVRSTDTQFVTVKIRR